MPRTPSFEENAREAEGRALDAAEIDDVDEDAEDERSTSASENDPKAGKDDDDDLAEDLDLDDLAAMEGPDA